MRPGERVRCGGRAARSCAVSGVLARPVVCLRVEWPQGGRRLFVGGPGKGTWWLTWTPWALPAGPPSGTSPPGRDRHSRWGGGQRARVRMTSSSPDGFNLGAQRGSFRPDGSVFFKRSSAAVPSAVAGRGEEASTTPTPAIEMGPLRQVGVQLSGLL